MLRNRLPVKQAALVGAVALSMVLAGCVDFFTAQGAAHGFASFEEAFAASSEEHAPEQGDSTLRMKLLQPAADMFPVGEDVAFWILLYDSSGPHPIRDAAIDLNTHMPAHEGMDGHGTGHEVDPEHDSFGIYRGETNLVMAGQWELQFTVVADDAGVKFVVPVMAMGEDGMDHDQDMGDNESMDHDEHMGDNESMDHDEHMGDNDTMGDDEHMGGNNTGNETGNGTGIGNETDPTGPAEPANGTWYLNLLSGNGQTPLRSNFTLNGTASVVNVTLNIMPYLVQNNEAAPAPISVIQAFTFALQADDGTELGNVTTGPGAYVHPAETGQGVVLTLPIEVADVPPGLYWMSVTWVGALISFEAVWTVTP